MSSGWSSLPSATCAPSASKKLLVVGSHVKLSSRARLFLMSYEFVSWQLASKPRRSRLVVRVRNDGLPKHKQLLG